LPPWLRPESRAKPLPRHLVFGQWGEDQAACYLRRHGYRILYRNFVPSGGGEVDLVCRDKPEDTLVFVEVKTRASEARGRPADAVDYDKQRRIARGAMAWLRLLNFPDIRFRFDIVEVLARSEATPEITLIRNAFPLPEYYLY
jgi:Predicted endonuclease distantly related to archaeal Holliday junction resolvase